MCSELSGHSIKIRINKIRNERGEVAIDIIKIPRIIKDCYEQLYTNKLNYLEIMDKFPATYNLLRLNQEEKNLNRMLPNNKLESVIKQLSTNKSPGTDGLIGEFYHTFKEELLPILFILF